MDYLYILPAYNDWFMVWLISSDANNQFLCLAYVHSQFAMEFQLIKVFLFQLYSQTDPPSV